MAENVVLQDLTPALLTPALSPVSELSYALIQQVSSTYLMVDPK